MKRCTVCRKEVGSYNMCDTDERAGVPAEPGEEIVWCNECFARTPCGQGKHGEECPTHVEEG